MTYQNEPGTKVICEKQILDHGFLKLIDTMPLVHYENSGHLTSCDLRIVAAARVSNVGLNGTGRTVEQDTKLIKFLMDNGHTTPFEQVQLTFAVKLPIFVARQWIRHRTASVNEISARYVKLPCEFYVPAQDRMQAQSSSNKQGSAEQLSEPYAGAARADITYLAREAYVVYERLLKGGLARELARMVLPTNFYTEWYWTANLHNVFNFLRLRLHPHAQYEIRVYAEAMLDMVRAVAPVATAAFIEKHDITVTSPNEPVGPVGTKRVSMPIIGGTGRAAPELQHSVTPVPVEIQDTKVVAAPDSILRPKAQVGGSHYMILGIDPYAYAHANNLGALEFQVVKYVTRWRDKGGAEDLRKAINTIERLLALEEDVSKE